MACGLLKEEASREQTSSDCDPGTFALLEKKKKQKKNHWSGFLGEFKEGNVI